MGATSQSLASYFSRTGKKLKKLDTEARSLSDSKQKMPYRGFVQAYLSFVWLVDFVSTQGLDKERLHLIKYLNRVLAPALSNEYRPLPLMEALDFPANKKVFWPLVAHYPKKSSLYLIGLLADPWYVVSKNKESGHHNFTIRYYRWLLTDKRLSFPDDRLIGYQSSLYHRCVAQKAYRYAIYIHHFFPQQPSNDRHLSLSKSLFKLAYPKGFNKKWQQYLSERKTMYKKEKS